MTANRVNVAVLTVIPAELDAVLQILAFGGEGRREKLSPSGTVIHRGAVRSELLGRDYEVVLGCIGGNDLPTLRSQDRSM